MKFIPNTHKKNKNSGLPNMYLGKRVIEDPLYLVWNSMRQRCYNPKVKNYHRWGGRGITVCKIWRESFISFYEWAIKNGWEKGLTIDRKNNNGNYCPSNCRIATHTQQARNKGKNKYVEWESNRILLVELCEKFGVVYHIVLKRLSKGWELKKALFTPNTSENRHLRKKRDIVPIEKRCAKTDLIYNGRMGQKYPIYINKEGNYIINKLSASGQNYEYIVTQFKHLFTKND